MKRDQKSIIDLIIDLEHVNNELNRIQEDPDYMKSIADSIPWKRRDYSSELNDLINNIL